MKNFAYFGKQLKHLLKFSSFWIELSYFIIISLTGFLALNLSTPRTASFRYTNLDIFFTSVSAATVSSMSTVEMETFSDTQLIIMIFLMLIGGEVFTSFLELHLRKYSLTNTKSLELVSFSSFGIEENETKQVENDIEISNIKNPESNSNNQEPSSNSSTLMYESTIRKLGYVILGYFLVVQMVGFVLVVLYTSLVSSARKVLHKKGLHIPTFSMFTIVSTFSNCGFIPTNENMIVFKKNSGLLLLLISQTLLGNTLYAPSLRFVIWVLEKITKKMEFRYILRNSKEMGYNHLLSSVQSWFLVWTVLGFIVIQFVLFCSMEWDSQMMDGLSLFEKLVAAFFQVVNSRHSGESVFDLSVISPAILVLFVVMMYLPPYFSYMPVNLQEEVGKSGKESKKHGKITIHSLLFSQLSYLVIFIILICIAERERMKTDPLNFNVLNITLEVISAYGNVGFSTGYSCERQIKPENSCKDAGYGFAGKWSNLAKFILIVIMFFGRLKKYTINGGKAWKIS